MGADRSACGRLCDGIGKCVMAYVLHAAGAFKHRAMCLILVECRCCSRSHTDWQRFGLHRRLHQLHDAHGDEFVHCEFGGGRFLCDIVLSAADGRLGRNDDVVLWRDDVQGGAVFSGL